jgi:hypothetical protein
LAGLIGVALLAVVLWAGASGIQLPGLNFAPTFVFITFWLGTVLLSVLLGDVFLAFNPWRAIGRAYGWGLKRLTGEPWRPPLRYPERLGRWPAAVGLVAFAWLELIYGASNPAGLQPHDVAIAAAVYSGYTLAGMALFGTEVWLERGETFSVYFGMFSGWRRWRSDAGGSGSGVPSRLPHTGRLSRHRSGSSSRRSGSPRSTVPRRVS